MHYEVRTLKYNRLAVTRVNDDGTSDRLVTVETDCDGARCVANILNEYERQKKNVE